MNEGKWYVVRVITGHENKAKSSLEYDILNVKDEASRDRLTAKIQQILVPTEKVFEVKDGKKKSKIKNFFPGYILIQADLDSQVKEFIVNNTSILGFLGTGGVPNPLQPEEVKRIIGRITSQDDESERIETIFRTGDIVKIIDGPFNNFSGTVQEVNEEKMKIKVMVSIFGRKTPVEIDFVQAELEK